MSESKNLEIIKANLSDLLALQDIGASSYLPHYQHLWLTGGVQWYMQRCFGTRVLQDELSDENIEYHFVRVDGENVGFAKIVLQKSVPNSSVENALYLEKVYFIKEFTGKGAGRRTIDFAVARAQELRRAAIWLMAMDTSDKPIAAYERAGFVEFARTRLDDREFALMKPEMRGMVIMMRDLRK